MVNYIFIKKSAAAAPFEGFLPIENLTVGSLIDSFDCCCEMSRMKSFNVTSYKGFFVPFVWLKPVGAVCFSNNVYADIGFSPDYYDDLLNKEKAMSWI